MNPGKYLQIAILLGVAIFCFCVWYVLDYTYCIPIYLWCGAWMLLALSMFVGNLSVFYFKPIYINWFEEGAENKSMFKADTAIKFLFHLSWIVSLCALIYTWKYFDEFKIVMLAIFYVILSGIVALVWQMTGHCVYRRSVYFDNYRHVTLELTIKNSFKDDDINISYYILVFMDTVSPTEKVSFYYLKSSVPKNSFVNSESEQLWVLDYLVSGFIKEKKYNFRKMVKEECEKIQDKKAMQKRADLHREAVDEKIKSI